MGTGWHATTTSAGAITSPHRRATTHRTAKANGGTTRAATFLGIGKSQFVRVGSAYARTVFGRATLLKNAWMPSGATHYIKTRLAPTTSAVARSKSLVFWIRTAGWELVVLRTTPQLAMATLAIATAMETKSPRGARPRPRVKEEKLFFVQ